MVLVVVLVAVGEGAENGGESGGVSYICLLACLFIRLFCWGFVVCCSIVSVLCSLFFIKIALNQLPVSGSILNRPCANLMSVYIDFTD